MRNRASCLRVFLLAVLLAFAAPRTRAQYLVVDVDSPMVFALCYEDLLDTGITFTCINGQQLYLLICAGQLETCCDQLFLYDGGDTLAPTLYNGSGDVAGISAMSTGDSLTCRITSNDSINCWTAPYLPIVWSVGCGQGYPCTIGIPEHDAAMQLDLYPVPASDVLHVRVGRPWSAPWVLEAIDPTGRVVLTNTSTDSAFQQGQLDVSGLRPGDYLLFLRNADGVRTARFVVGP